jgi:rRNA maturation endonuclease Nob1
MKVRTVHKPDGTISVIHPVINSRKFFLVDDSDPQDEVLEILSKNKYTIALEYENQHPGTFKFEPEGQWLERVFEKATSTGTLQRLPYEDIDDSTLPDREDRESWEPNPSGGVRINIAKALQIKKDKNTESLIKAEEKRIINEQAIANLTGQGKIDENGEITDNLFNKITNTYKDI